MKEIKWNEEQNKLIDSMVDDVKDEVTKIENGLELTKGHYSKYMSIISAHKQPILKRVMAEVLLRAGANLYGVEYAYKFATGQF